MRAIGMECKHTQKDAPENAVCEDCGRDYIKEAHPWPKKAKEIWNKEFRDKIDYMEHVINEKCKR